MTTVNTVVTDEWTKVADIAAADFLIDWEYNLDVEFATTSTDTTPTVIGHKIKHGQKATRDDLGAGYVWAKLKSGSNPESLILIVSSNTQADSAATTSGEAHIGEVGGAAANPSANFTRPSDTTAYASGDLVANSTTAGSVAMMQFTVARVAAGSFMLRRARLHKSSVSLTNASFRLHLYRAAVTAANGDNGAWLTSGAANYLGTFDITVDRAFTDGASGSGVPLTGFDITVKLASGQIIYGLLEARAAYTPASAEVFTVTLEDLQN